MPRVLRMRVFAGPNGSGKTTIINSVRKARVNDRPVDFGLYLNADEMARDLEKGVDLGMYEVDADEPSFLEFATSCGLLKNGFTMEVLKKSYRWKGSVTRTRKGAPKDRVSQLLCQYLYDRLLSKRRKFTFETVFSHDGKLELMRRANAEGYKVYLYFIATEDPGINVQRVKEIRVKEGGHDVPKEKIIDRYHRTLAHLDEALSLSYHAYLWDNSQIGPATLFCEMKRTAEGVQWHIDAEKVPVWFMEHFLAKHRNDPLLRGILRQSVTAFIERMASGSTGGSGSSAEDPLEV